MKCVHSGALAHKESMEVARKRLEKKGTVSLPQTLLSWLDLRHKGTKERNGPKGATCLGASFLGLELCPLLDVS